MEALIDAAFERRSEITPANVERDLSRALDEIVHKLETGELRVAEKRNGGWVTHQWIR